MSDSLIYRDFTKAREGGLSKAKTDSAHKYPVPDKSGNHTNKGITWQLFEELGDDLGYVPTPALFYEMPDWLFNKIYDNRWEKSGAALIESQPIANLLFQSLWGGGNKWLIEKIQLFFAPKVGVTGHIGPITSKLINDFCKNKADEIALHEYVYKKRDQYLRSLDAFKANGGGWMKRMVKLYKFNQSLLLPKK